MIPHNRNGVLRVAALVAALVVTVALWIAVLSGADSDPATRAVPPAATAPASGAESPGATAGGAETGGAQTRGAETGGAETEGTDPVVGPSPTGVESATRAAVEGGKVTIERTVRWTGAAPAAIGVPQPDLTEVAGVPDDLDLRVGQPRASIDGKDIDVLEAPGGGWQILTPRRQGPGELKITYPLTGALHRDPASPPGRALAVVPLTRIAGRPAARELRLSGENILNVSCPTSDGTVQLCGRRSGDDWVIKVPANGEAVLAQIDEGAG